LEGVERELLRKDRGEQDAAFQTVREKEDQLQPKARRKISKWNEKGDEKTVRREKEGGGGWGGGGQSLSGINKNLKK